MGARWRGFAAVCVLAVVAGAAGCSSGGPEGDGAERPSRFEVGQATDDRFEIADGLVLDVEPGDFAGEGTVDVSKSDVEEPDVAGYEAFADPVDLTVSGEVESDLMLEMTAEVPEDAFGMVLRFDEDAGWYPIAVADDDGVVAIDRGSFSPLSWGWARIQDLSDAVAGTVRGLLGKRHDPPQCPDPSPEWFAVDPPAVDVVTVCATSNADPEGGTARGEVRVVNNRGAVLEVQIPSGVVYAFVDGQPDPIRAAARQFTGRDSVLLAPGQLMTVGFTQPEAGSFTPLRVDYTAPATIASMLLELIGSADGYAAVYAALAECGVAPEPLDARLAPSGLADVITSAINCFKEVASDPEGAATLAAEAIAAINGVAPAIALSDRAFATKVDELAGNLRKAARAIAIVSVGSDLIDAASDLYLNTDLGDFNSLSPGITRRAIPAPPTLSEVALAFARAVLIDGDPYPYVRDRRVAEEALAKYRSPNRNSSWTVSLIPDGCSIPGDIVVECQVELDYGPGNLGGNTVYGIGVLNADGDDLDHMTPVPAYVTGMWVLSG